MSEFIREERKARVKNMLQARLGSVIVIVEAVHRRHNTSAILRSAEAFGVHEVHLISEAAFRSSKGAAKGAERWLELHTWDELNTCVEHVRKRGFSVWAADLHSEAHTPETLPLTKPVAILFGNELNGISDEARRTVDGFVTIPMFGLTESLNVSVATGCILNRVAARRRELVGGAGDLCPMRQEEFFTTWVKQQHEMALGVKARVDKSSA